MASAIAHVKNADDNVNKKEEMAACIKKETTTYVVDRQKGSAAGIPAEVPEAEERRCLRYLVSHVISNVGEMSNRWISLSVLFFQGRHWTH